MAYPIAEGSTKPNERQFCESYIFGYVCIHPYFNVKMATLVFCEFDIMIIIGFMIDDDFAAWDRCDNWVGSLFGGSRQGGTCLFHPPLIIAALPRGLPPRSTKPLFLPLNHSQLTLRFLV